MAIDARSASSDAGSASSTQHDLVPICNFCGSTKFIDHNGRSGERCEGCGSLRRHRVALEVYTRKGLLNAGPATKGRRVLHLAPEYLLSAHIRAVVGGGYITGDANPSAYGSAQCLKLAFPEAFDIFPNDYFDYVVHNHVLEHIPGSFRDHIIGFTRIIKPWGYLIFSVPGPNMRVNTIEGGEHLASDNERLIQFGQADHLKLFGKDLPEFLDQISNGVFQWDPLTNQDRARLSVEPYSNRFLIWRKHRAKGASTF